MDFEREVSTLSASGVLGEVLRELCDVTDMGFAAVARVTEHRWIACQVLDKIEFGLEPGGELKVSTTICNEIRDSGEAVYIDCVGDAPMWRTHPTPILYGFQSYVSVPLNRADGSFFGTLCAIDPVPHVVDTPEIRSAIDDLSRRVVACLDRKVGAA
ncbi:GAF domain-containing protein [Sphingomonas sp.]|jgi:GAF domain-containing protein|uniref:GAF domain-containing protein n=1 Tax=Sphingomonas sp. TaxID=28214 RepID=UPI002E363841|nr:GAF domain-containing protein [Sphingomonas sp.]HEX4694106.1 GAF domain-containing protein [Sphingomonas sp.]